MINPLGADFFQWFGREKYKFVDPASVYERWILRGMHTNFRKIAFIEVPSLC